MKMSIRICCFIIIITIFQFELSLTEDSNYLGDGSISEESKEDFFSEIDMNGNNNISLEELKKVLMLLNVSLL